MQEASRRLSPLQYFYLSSLTAYTCGLSFLMHTSRKGNDGLYFVSTSVFMGEAMKLIICLFLERQSIDTRANDDGTGSEVNLLSDISSDNGDEEKQSNVFQHGPWQLVRNRVFSSDCWKLATPAVLYVCQNILQLYALTAITPGIYQAITQMKIVAASILSVLLLKRSYTRQQWISIVTLTIGVIVLSTTLKAPAQSSSVSSSESAEIATTTKVQDLVNDGAAIIGMVAVLMACSLGSAGAVVMEMVIKDAKASVWVRNVQLAMFSLIPAGAAMAHECYKSKTSNPLLHFGFWAWCTVVARSLGGILISLVLKHCDTILKGLFR